MGHLYYSHIGQTRITLVGAATPDGTSIADPHPSNTISTGIASDQAVALVTGRTATAGGNLLVTDNTIVSVVDAYKGHIVKIVSGTGAGQSRLIISNTNAGAFTVNCRWTTNPIAGSIFSVYRPSTATPVIRGWWLNHTGVAGTLNLRSTGIVGSTFTANNIFIFVNGAATGTDARSAFSMVGIPGGDLAVITSAASTGDVQVDGYWIEDKNGVVDI